MQESTPPGTWAFRLALCLVGPIFFFSYIFSLFSPLPTLYLHAGNPQRRSGLLWSILAAAIGCALAASIKGLVGALGFLILAALPAILLGELLLRKKGAEVAIMGAFLLMLSSLSITSYFYASSKSMPLLPALTAMAEKNIRLTADHLLSQKEEELPPQTMEELKKLSKEPKELLSELPGLALAILLLLASLPCVLLIRWNPKGFLRRAGIPRDFLRKWKAPDWLVWPTLACGAFLVFEYETYTLIAKNLLKPILLIYFFQGMSILAFFLDSLRLRGPIRVIFYGAGVFFLTPMVVSFGFFDLWFNFRGRQKPQDEDIEP